MRHLFVTLTLLGDKISHKTSRSSASCHLWNLSCTMFSETWVLECCMDTSFATLHFDWLWFSVVACICLLHRIFLHERWRLHVFVGITRIFCCCCGNYDSLVDIDFSSMVKTHYHYHWVVIKEFSNNHAFPAVGQSLSIFNNIFNMLNNNIFNKLNSKLHLKFKILDY